MKFQYTVLVQTSNADPGRQKCESVLQDIVCPSSDGREETQFSLFIIRFTLLN